MSKSTDTSIRSRRAADTRRRAGGGLLLLLQPLSLVHFCLVSEVDRAER